MDSFSSEITLPRSAVEKRFTRADLVFYGVDHGGDSFVARVFLDPVGDAGRPDLDELSPDRQQGYAGMFSIFGHGGCFGEEDHCHTPEHDPFDTRPPQGLTPQTKVVDVTDALKAIEGDHVRVTVIPVVPSDEGALREDVLRFTDLRLLTYR